MLTVSVKHIYIFLPDRIVVPRIALNKSRITPLPSFLSYIWPLFFCSPLHHVYLDCCVKGTGNKKKNALCRRVGVLILGMLMNNIVFEMKSRKSSKKLEAKLILFLCTFPLKLFNVLKYSHVVLHVPFFTVSGKKIFIFFILILKITLDIFSLDFVYLVIENFLSWPG